MWADLQSRLAQRAIRQTLMLVPVEGIDERIALRPERGPRSNSPGQRRVAGGEEPTDSRQLVSQGMIETSAPFPATTGFGPPRQAAPQRAMRSARPVHYRGRPAGPLVDGAPKSVSCL